MTDLYAVLGVQRDATQEQIRRAYRKLSKRLHPDAGGTAEAMAELNLAYQVLSSPKQRARYDETGAFDAGSVLNEEAEVYRCIDRVVALLLSTEQDYLAFDVIEVLIGFVKAELKPLQAELNKIERVLTRSKRADGRFTPQSADEDRIERILDWHRRNATEGQKALRREIKIRTDAIAVIKGYSYQPEPGAVAGVGQSSSLFGKAFGLG